jgi:hypothetical protein
MFAPDVLDRILQTCIFRSRDVLCPNRDRIASITAAKFFVEDDEDWTVLECSLQPGGEVNCAMTCLLRDFDKNS